MGTTSDNKGARSSAAADSDYVYGRRGEGWVIFAVGMLGLGGLWAMIEGVLAISNSKVFVANTDLVFSSLNTWGWIVLILGIVSVCAALAVFTGSELARWFGIAVAGVNALGQLAFVPASPWWGTAMFALDVLVIYALAAYGGKQLRST